MHRQPGPGSPSTARRRHWPATDLCRTERIAHALFQHAHSTPTARTAPLKRAATVSAALLHFCPPVAAGAPKPFLLSASHISRASISLHWRKEILQRRRRPFPVPLGHLYQVLGRPPSSPHSRTCDPPISRPVAPVCGPGAWQGPAQTWRRPAVCY